jgi:hypothetical protein
MKDLPQPFQTWLTQSHLTSESNGNCLLFVDNHSVDLINEVSVISLIYPVVKSMYPDMTSLHVVSFPVKNFVKDNHLSLHSVKAVK